MNNMFNGDFSPYDALIQLSERVQRLEQAHNRLAEDYIRSQAELDTTMKALNSLQRGHLALSDLVASQALLQLGEK